MITQELGSVEYNPGYKQVEVYDEFNAPYGGHKVVVLGSCDWRAKAAFDIELFNMMMLGDPEELARQDLINGFENAKFLALYNNDEYPADYNMLGVVRITDADPKTGEIGTIHEIAKVTGDSYDDVFKHFVAQTGQTDPTKVFDITTYGMSPLVWERANEDKELFQNTKYNLMYAMSYEGVKQYQQEGKSTALAYFNAFSKNYFVNKGYDWKDLNGYLPKNDVFINDNGIEVVGQLVVPTVLDIKEHIDRMNNGLTLHLGEIATFMFSKGVTLPKPQAMHTRRAS
ncbi:hypothetical protein EBZ38_09080 [bacterium]|nr:hypothetical protein [bacterium]NDD84407.1 hypothetical protein [bacterium]